MGETDPSSIKTFKPGYRSGWERKIGLLLRLLSLDIDANGRQICLVIRLKPGY